MTCRFRGGSRARRGHLPAADALPSHRFRCAWQELAQLKKELDWNEKFEKTKAAAAEDLQGL